MARRRLSTNEGWRIIRMKNGEMSRKAIARQLAYHHSVIARLIQKHAQTTDVKDRPKPKTTSVREYRNLLGLVRRTLFTKSGM